jgi:hypothetical protein
VNDEALAHWGAVVQIKKKNHSTAIRRDLLRRISPKSVKKRRKVLHTALYHNGHFSTNHWHLIVLLRTFHISTRIANKDIQLMFTKEPVNATQPMLHIFVFVTVIFILFIFNFRLIQLIQ